jgi:hypothetical protein
MKYRPAARLRPPLIGFKVVRAQIIACSQSRARLHRASLSTTTRRKVAARATRKCPKSRALNSHKNRRLLAVRRVAWASICRGTVHRRRRHSPARHRVVNAFTGLLSQVRLGGKWRRAQRASALIQGLSAILDCYISAARWVAWASSGRGPVHR